MRSHPSCWNKTLAQLGFRRKRRKATKRDYLKRRSLFENLEQRQMLSRDALIDPASDEIIVSAGVTDQPLLFFSSKPEFVLLQPEIPQDELESLPAHEHDEIEPVFLVETVETKSGSKAVISFNPNMALTVNPPQPITHRVTVQPTILSNDDGSNTAEMFGTPEQAAIYFPVLDLCPLKAC